MKVDVRVVVPIYLTVDTETRVIHKVTVSPIAGMVDLGDLLDEGTDAVMAIEGTDRRRELNYTDEGMALRRIGGDVAWVWLGSSEDVVYAFWPEQAKEA